MGISPADRRSSLEKEKNKSSAYEKSWRVLHPAVGRLRLEQ